MFGILDRYNAEIAIREIAPDRAYFSDAPLSSVIKYMQRKGWIDSTQIGPVRFKHSLTRKGLEVRNRLAAPKDARVA